MKILLCEETNFYVYFPFKTLKHEQKTYMLALKKIFDKPTSNSYFKVPPGISKPLCLFSVYFTYLAKDIELPKLIFSTHSVHEINRIAAIAKSVWEAINKDGINLHFNVISVSDKRNLCINTYANSSSNLEEVESKCLSKIAPWIRNNQKVKNNCQYYENYLNVKNTFPPGCYSIDDLTKYGTQNNSCPYYQMNDIICQAEVLICNFFYLKTLHFLNSYLTDMEKGRILFIEETCNLDTQIQELFTERISLIPIDFGYYFIDEAKQMLTKTKDTHAQKYQEEYAALVQGFSKSELDINTQNKKNLEILNGVSDSSEVKFPGYIRKPEHFITHLKKLMHYLKSTIVNQTKAKKVFEATTFLKKYFEENGIDETMNPFKYFVLRLMRLLNFLEISDFKSISPVITFAKLAENLGLFLNSCQIILDTGIKNNDSISQVCVDPEGPFKLHTANAQNVILNTEVLEDSDFLLKLLGIFETTIVETIPMVTKPRILPLIVNRGADQIELSTEVSKQHDAGVMKNYSNMIVSLSDYVPDGIFCLFPSMKYIADIGIDCYDEVLDKSKLVFAESANFQDTIKSVAAYKVACDNGRGAVFYGLMHGNVAGNMTFELHQAKCILFFGMPIEYDHPREFVSRLKYLKNKKGINENDYIRYYSMKEVNSLIARMVKSTHDSLILIFADRRYLQADKMSKLPSWVLENLEEMNKGIGSDQVHLRVSKFLKSEISTPKLDNHFISFSIK